MAKLAVAPSRALLPRREGGRLPLGVGVVVRSVVGTVGSLSGLAVRRSRGLGFPNSGEELQAR